MNAERWARIKTIVADVLELPHSGRGSHLDGACGDDAELRSQVESLLAASDSNESFDIGRNAIAAAAKDIMSTREETFRSLLEGALGQQYEIIRLLGRGGMGYVYLARERALERFVAIKALNPDVAKSPQSRERFRREARVVARLSHPGILQLHTFGEVRDIRYFVMSYVPGESLAERLRIEPRLPWAQVYRIMTELTDALACAHENGVVHRDIKPANVLLDSETGRAILADFGISKSSGTGESLTFTDAVVGTPDYMSPEQAQGSDDLDERSDIYSLGAVAYTMLAGRSPFASRNAAEAMYDRVKGDPIPLLSVAPWVPEALATVVMKCLARDRSRRWRSARALKEALAQVSSGASTDVPDTLRNLPSFGPYAALWVVVVIGLALLTSRQPSERLLLVIIAVLVPVGLILHVWNAGQHGLSVAQVARIACWPPEWWSMWWPSALRRPSDLWKRLPLPARAVRVALSAFFIAVPLLILLRDWLSVTGRLDAADPRQEWFPAAHIAALVITATVVGAGFLWTKLRGMSADQSVLLLLGQTVTSPAWTAPAVARLLTPEQRVVPPEHGVPSDHRRAIADLLRSVPADVAERMAVVEKVSDGLMRAIEESDRELVALGESANTAELERLTTQLAALGEPVPHESRERQELRDILRHQLDVLRRMRERRDRVSQERSHRFDLLRNLWTHLKSVVDSTASADAMFDDTVVGICRECASILGELDTAASTSPVQAPPIPLPATKRISTPS